MSQEFSEFSTPKPTRAEDGPRSEKLTPDLLEWARKQFSEAEIVAGLHEIRTTGGLELQDFIDEIEGVVERRG